MASRSLAVERYRDTHTTHRRIDEDVGVGGRVQTRRPRCARVVAEQLEYPVASRAIAGVAEGAAPAEQRDGGVLRRRRPGPVVRRSPGEGNGRVAMRRGGGHNHGAGGDSRPLHRRHAA